MAFGFGPAQEMRPVSQHCSCGGLHHTPIFMEQLAAQRDFQQGAPEAQSPEPRADSPLECHVRTLNSITAAADPNRMFGAHAASSGDIAPPAPSAPNTLNMIQ